MADDDATAPPSDVSRESEIQESPTGLLSVAGGKLTTFRAMGEAVLDRVVRRLPLERRRAAGPSRTFGEPLRCDDFDAAALAADLQRDHHLEPRVAEHLVRAWGHEASALLDAATPEARQPIGRSRYLYAEIPWAFRTECAVTLSDVLERRVRLALFAEGQGLPELARIAKIAGDALGWDAERARAETRAYIATVRRRYQIAANPVASPAAARAVA